MVAKKRRGYCLTGVEFWLGKVEEVLEMDGHDGCTAV